VLIRIVYLRTQLEVCTSSSRGAGRAPRPEDLHWIVESIGAEAGRGRFAVLASACAEVSTLFASAAAGSVVSARQLARLDDWLHSAERYLRDTSSARAALELSRRAQAVRRADA
jgi:hypothetical protein